jgi:Type I phosphodiesterase / nucleotide pyrophosphatase
MNRKWTRICSNRCSRASSSIFISTFLLASIFLIAAIHGCSRSEPTAPARRVILVALDGADWTMLDRLIRAGRLPNLARMKANGAAGVLRSQEPIFSPIIWASIATGKTPFDHGIQSFTVPVDGLPVPVTSNLYRAPRLWQILSSRERLVGVIGWWTSWPATAVNGFLCSERTWPLTMGDHGMPTTSDGSASLQWRTWPASLMESLEPLIVTRQTLSNRHLTEVDVTGPLGTVGDKGPCVADIYAKDITFMAISEYLYPALRPEFFTVYLEITDVMAHYFWDYWRYYRHSQFGETTEFNTPPQNISPQTAAYIGRNFEKAYEYADRAIGRLMAMADDSTMVMVVSDHGYGENPNRERLQIGDGIFARNPHWHRLDGVLLAWGAGVAQGMELPVSSILDVAPTILYAMGEPGSADMPGRLIEDLFKKTRQGLNFGLVATYDSLVTNRSSRPVTSDEDEEYRKLLRSLGYIN